MKKQKAKESRRIYIDMKLGEGEKEIAREDGRRKRKEERKNRKIDEGRKIDEEVKEGGQEGRKEGNIR